MNNSSSSDDTNSYVETICGLEFKCAPGETPYNEKFSINLQYNKSRDFYVCFYKGFESVEARNKYQAVKKMLDNIQFIENKAIQNYIKLIENHSNEIKRYTKLLKTKTDTINLIHNLGIKE